MHLSLPLAYFYFPSGYFGILFILVIAFSLYAQIRVSSAYSKNSKVPSRGGITGREAAAAVMARAGIADVDIVEIPGHMTDHYDPRTRGSRSPPRTTTGRASRRSASPPTRRATRCSTRRATRCSSSA
jgi:Zn-dependent membrane protease YugP